MYLARRENGKSATVYNADSFHEFKDVNGRIIKKVAREEMAWTFQPKLGHEGSGAPSTLCEGGFAALALSSDRALKMIAELEANATRRFN
jgi:hypothetical protein